MEARPKRSAFYHIVLLVVLAMLGDIMFISDILMEFLPNVHIVGVLTVVYTIVYRWKALIPIYIYVFLNGLFSGGGIWWLGYLYIWAFLWGAVMLVPRRLPLKLRTVLYVAICTLHGLSFGVLYAPVQMIYNSDPNYILAWISIGFVTADIYHGIGNCIFGVLLIRPLSELLIRLDKSLTVM